MTGALRPERESDVVEAVRGACHQGTKLDIVGGGTRRGLGRPRAGVREISSERLSGIVFYAPEEMTICAKAGTTLETVEATVGQRGQMLPFEPMRPQRLWGASGEPTLGGTVATNLSGPRRLSAGAVRDAVLGVRLVNGLGEPIRCGGRVMKNVTGLDLTKLNCGAHGTLGFLLEATVKLAPKPENETTLAIPDIDDVAAIDAMTRALGSPFGVSGAAWIAAGMGDEPPRALLRLEGFEDSIAYRARRLIELLAGFGRTSAISGEESAVLWRSIRDVHYVAEPHDRAVWRISIAPSRAASFVACLGETTLAHFYDWGGGLIWLATDASKLAAGVVRRALASAGGHATLMRAPEELRAAVAVFQPPSNLELRLNRGLKSSFDPGAVLNFGRMYEGV